MKITTISYGIAIIVISSIMYYLTRPGIENCDSMTGIVSTYTSQDYAVGCQILTSIQTCTIIIGIAGIGIAVFGILRRSKIK
ncbi:MAG: hypothetical protein KGH89_05885 [Thaumarchaeota archaeon]|nr:hypothetical protein [Nitrososphaerota archaeon]